MIEHACESAKAALSPQTRRKPQRSAPAYGGAGVPRSGAHTSRGSVTKYEVNSRRLCLPQTVPFIVKYYTGILQPSTNGAVEAAIRIGLVFLLAAWCFLIVKPFIIPILWGMIIAIACFPCIPSGCRNKLGGRSKLAATDLHPAGAGRAHHAYGDASWTPSPTRPMTLSVGAPEGQSLTIPPPPASVQSEWPLVGEELSVVLDRRLGEPGCDPDLHCPAPQRAPPAGC